MGAFVQLFPDPAPAPPPVDPRPAAVSARPGPAAAALRELDRRLTTWPGAVAASVLSHIALVVILALRGLPGGGGPPAPDADLRLFAEAVRSVGEETGTGSSAPSLFGLEPGGPESPEDLRLFARAVQSLIREGAFDPAAAAASESAPTAEPDAAFAFDPELSDADKIEIFKQLLRSPPAGEGGPGGAASVSVPLDSGETMYMTGAASGAGRMEIHKLGQADAEALARLRSGGAPPREAPEDMTGTVAVLAGGLQEVPAEYYYRESPCEHMLARGGTLFTAVRRFPDLIVPVGPPGGDPSAPGFSAPAAEASPVFVHYLKSAPVFAPAGPASGAPAMPRTAAEIERVLGDLMAFPEEEQFGRFEREFLGRLDLDDEDLASLTREFLYGNINGALFVLDRVSSAFDSLEDLHFKRAVFDRLAEWIRRAPRSRTAAELLFYLASAYDYERRVMLYLAAAGPDAADILERRVPRPDLFDAEAKAYVVKAVGDDLRARLGPAGYVSIDQAAARYAAEQLEIYETLMTFRGETRSRALFAAGRLFWDEGDFETALDYWRRVPVTCKVQAARDIKKLFDAPAIPPLDHVIDRINRILAADSARNSAALHRRALEHHRWEVRSRAARPAGRIDRP